MLELIIENDMISDQLIENMNAHRKLLLRIIKIDKNLEFINDDEVVEVTPKSIRMRKIVLSAQKRFSGSR